MGSAATKRSIDNRVALFFPIYPAMGRNLTTVVDLTWPRHMSEPFVPRESRDLTLPDGGLNSCRDGCSSGSVAKETETESAGSDLGRACRDGRHKPCRHSRYAFQPDEKNHYMWLVDQGCAAGEIVV